MRFSTLALCVAASLLALAWLVVSVAELSGGLGETFRHWWTALPFAALALAVTATAAAARRR